MKIMEDNKRLFELVELALGSPENGAVNFNVLKTLLFGILDSTKTSHFTISAAKFPKEERKDLNSENSLNGEDEARQSQSSNLVENEKSSRDGEGPNNNTDHQAINASHLGSKDGERRLTIELQDLREEVKRLSSTQEDFLRRLSGIEREHGIGMFDSMPTSKELLAIIKEDSFTDGNRGTNQHNDLKSHQSDIDAKDNLENKHYKSKPIQDSKVLNSTWQNVRVNKRLQAIEDGMEKLFTMLDLLTAEQQRLENVIVDRKTKDEFIKSDTHLNKEQNQETDTVGVQNIIDSNNQLKGEFDNLARNISELEKRFKEFEENRQNDKMDKSLPNNDDLSTDLQKLKDALKSDIDGVKSILNDHVSRDELTEFVKWPALEEALKVRERKEKKKDDIADEVADLKPPIEVLEQKGDLISFEKADENSKENDGHSNQDEKTSKDSSRNNSSKHPSEDMRECLEKISEVVALYDQLETKMQNLSTCQEDLLKNSQNKEDISRTNLEDLKDQLESTTQTAECNKSLIDTARQEIDALVKGQQKGQGSAEFDDYVIGIVKGQMLDLEDQGNNTSMALNHLNNTMQNELRAKQLLIDALYECVEQLQHNKADVTNATSIFDLEAYKSALDTKVNMSEFDETMANLDQNLRDVIDRIEQYSIEEEGLRNALAKMSDDMRDKLDAKAGESLKKYLESRIAKLQKSRENLVSRADRDLSNAAGTRRPLASLFHCISCDRPVNLPGLVPLPTISQRFPKKKNKGLITSNALEEKPVLGKDHSFDSQGEESNDNNNNHQLELWSDSFAANRPCGGSHTAFPYAVKKPGKNGAWNQNNAILENARPRRFVPGNYRKEKSVVDLLLGTDGHVYRGRYKLNDLRYSNKMSSSFDRRSLRSRSAEVPRPIGNTSRRNHESNSDPNSVLSSPRSLSPLFHEAGLVNTPVESIATNRSEPTTRRESKKDRSINDMKSNMEQSFQ